MQTINEMLESVAKYEPGRTAVIFEDRQITYKQLNMEINRLANGLVRLGIRRGDFVMTLIPNSLRLLIIYQAVIRTGATVVPLNVMYTAHEIRYIGQDTKARAIFADADLWASHAAVKADLPDLERAIISKGNPAGGELSLADVNTDVTIPPETGSEIDDIVSIIYTSGTTGRPKGATQTHRSILSNVMGCCTRNKFSRDDRLICALPLYNNFALNVVMMSAFFTGATLVCIDRFEARKVLDAIKQHRGTYFAGTPTMFSYLLQEYKEGQDDVSSLRVTNSGGAHCPGEVIRQIEKTFGVVHMDGYGQTEGCGFTTLNPYIGVRKENSVGPPLSNCLIKIVDNDDKDLPVGETGEIVLRGDCFSIHGYLNRPEVNAEVNRGGWFHSGDLGYLDKDGYLYVVDRKQDLIITGGQNIYPAEVEEELYTHPAVALAAVIGIPDKVKGEIAKAYIVLKKGQKATEKEIINYVRERIAKFKAPRQVEFVDSLPQGPTGKILKRILKEEVLKKME
ncbi:MAG: class I adenylate-forming enzyme family protein [Syntrophales bacterium]